MIHRLVSGGNHWNKKDEPAEKSQKRPRLDSATGENVSWFPRTRFRRTELNLQLKDIDSSEQRSPLGLTLNKTPAFMRSLEMKLSQANHGSDQDISRAKMASNKFKASNFPATIVRIGKWKIVSKHEGDLVAKFYYARKKIVWEVLEGTLKNKIEINWSEIVGIRAVFHDNGPGILQLELNQQPSYFRETYPAPRKHTLWVQRADFTGGQASSCRMHYAVFPPGVLEKHYQNLLKCEPRLFELGQSHFPTQTFPYFFRNAFEFSEVPRKINGIRPELPPQLHYPVPSPAVSFPLHHDQHLKATGEHLVPYFPPVDERDRNYAVGNRRTVLLGQGGSNRSFRCQNCHAMNSLVEPRRKGPNSGMLVKTENHLLEDSKNHLLEDSKVLRPKEPPASH